MGNSMSYHTTSSCDDGMDELGVDDLRVIIRYLGLPCMRVGLFFMVVDAIGYFLREYLYIYLYPPVDPVHYYHFLAFSVGATVIVFSSVLIYLEEHP